MKSSFLATALVVGSMAVQAQAQAPRTIYLYNSSLGAPAPGVVPPKMGPWGNGGIRNSRQMDYEGAPVLEVTTRNLQEGARFDLPATVDLDPYRENGFLRLRVKFREQVGVAPGAEGGAPGMVGPGGVPGVGVPGGAVPGVPGAGGWGAVRQMVPQMAVPSQLTPRWQGSAQIGALPPIGTGGLPGFPAIGELGGPAALPPGPPPQSTPISTLRVTMVRDNGVTVGQAPVNLETMPTDDSGWHMVVIPVRSMTSTPEASGGINRLLLTADAEDTFFLAQTALVIESKEMVVAIRPANMPAGTQIGEITVKPGPLSLIADVEAGAADPAIEWNFDADNVGNLPPALFGGGGAPAAAGGNPLAPAGQVGTIQPANPGRTPARPALPARTVPAPAMDMGAAVPVVPTGPRIDARGLTASFTYPNEEQNYRIEVTVRDRSGQKPPVSASLLVRVRG